MYWRKILVHSLRNAALVAVNTDVDGSPVFATSGNFSSSRLESDAYGLPLGCAPMSWRAVADRKRSPCWAERSRCELVRSVALFFGLLGASSCSSWTKAYGLPPGLIRARSNVEVRSSSVINTTLRQISDGAKLELHERLHVLSP